jgi:glycosyltransferase involved in cell wall biosynthesis
MSRAPPLRGQTIVAPGGLVNDFRASRTPGMAALISVVVPTYDREDALGAVLRGLARQTDRNFDVIVADDGSGPATAALIELWTSRLEVPLIHVHQRDEGFRAAEIRNRAILASRGAYCIFLDGDCIPRPNFIAAHRALAEPGWFVTGNRALLSRQLTEAVLKDDLLLEMWTFGTFLGHRLGGRLNRLAPLAPLPLGPLRKLHPQIWQGARSCNLAVWRADLDRVDGFDASFTGWGLEDSDLLIRLMRAGARRKDGRFATGVLHLWHPPEDRTAMPLNERKLDELVRGDRIRAIKGLSAVAAEAAATTGARVAGHG